MRFKGSDRLWAGGKVTIDRSDFAARGDSLRLDTGKGSDGTLIGGNPVMRGLGRDSFNMAGRRLDLKLDQRELTYVVAKGEGHAISKEWDLVADTIGLDLNNRKLEQTLAWGDSIRPYANSPAYAMRADSLALDTPGQQLKEVRGFGTAWLGRDDRFGQQAARLDAGRYRGRPVRPARLGRHQARGAEPHRGPEGRPVVSHGPQPEAPGAAVDQLRPRRRHRHDHEAGRAEARGGPGGRPGPGGWDPARGQPTPPPARLRQAAPDPLSPRTEHRRR